MSVRYLKSLGRTAGHAILALLVATLGLIEAARRGFRPPVFNPRQVERILVIRLDLLGDVANSLPAIQALRQQFPRARLCLLVLPYAAPLLRAVLAADQVLTLDVNAYRRPRGWLHWRDLLDTLRLLRAGHFDLCVCLHGRIPSALALLSGARWRVGYRGESYPLAMNLPVPGYRYHRQRHEVEYCLDLVRVLGLPAPASQPRLALPADATIRAAELLRDGGWDGRRPVVVAHPGSSNGAAKRWPSALWAALADRIQRELEGAVVLTGTPDDTALVQSIERQMQTQPLALVGRTDLLQLAGLCRLSAVVVSGDTGPLHLAVAAGARVVGLFGPTDPAHYAPFSDSALVLQHRVPCGPCYDMRSPADCKLPDRALDCMWGITVDQVFSAVERALRDGKGAQYSGTIPLGS